MGNLKLSTLELSLGIRLAGQDSYVYGVSPIGGNSCGIIIYDIL